MADFPAATIKVRSNSSSWGPHKFNFTNAIPSGTALSSVTVKSYLGLIDDAEDADLASETETTSELIDTASVQISDSYYVSVYFNYPSTSSYLDGVNHTLVFNITLDNSATHNWYFHKVRVV